MPQIHAARRARAQASLAAAAAGPDAGAAAGAALITSPANVRYLTGLVSSNAAVLIPAGGQAVLATDSRYAEAAARDCADLELVCDRLVETALARLAARRGVTVLAFEAQEMTVERHDELAAALGEAVRLVPLGHAVEELRMVKDDTEIGLLHRACAITDAAFADLLDQTGPGRTERELAVALERLMTDHGADGPAFDTIVASGPNGAVPHHAPGGRVLAAGDLVTIDCGARLGGYHADMTRTVALGEPAAWQREIYDLVAAAQLAGVAAARPGTGVGELDATARDLIAAAGYGEYFGHGLGHGVGLEVHEAPIIGHGRTGTLMDRVPVTVEPGIYLPGRGGVRIEDTVVIRADGSGAAEPAEILTMTTKELLVL
ncbi:MAG TPA: Xaa-Pro peptidase family protein [Streptosporangiaceae bacterium]|nr:Xaa-Pro peptidase family protein [Streptosporangiaceae bacterium]